MLARMSLAVLVQRKGFGSAWWCEIGNQAEHPSLEGAFSQWREEPFDLVDP